MDPNGSPMYILKEGTERETGPAARSTSIQAARAIANAVKTTLGPRGMDKMLVGDSGDAVITNDGRTILDELEVEHPAARMLIEVARAQDESVGDGTSTSVVLAGELLGRAEALLEEGVHATILAEGYRKAADKATAILQDIGQDLEGRGRTGHLRHLAETSLASKAVASAREGLATLVVEAIEAVAHDQGGRTVVDLDDIQVQKAPGADILETELVDGIVLDKERLDTRMPAAVDDARIALVDAAFEARKTEVESHIEITDPDQMAAFLAEEEKNLRTLVGHVEESGANVLFTSKGIDDMAQHFLARSGVFAVRRVPKATLERIAKATGGTIVSSVRDLSADELGAAGRVEERRYAETTFTVVTECDDPKAVSLVLRGGSDQVVDELERALHDAMSVVATAVEDGLMVPGGGASAEEIAVRLREWAPSVGGREQMAVEAFADAIEEIPRALAENAGLDEIDIVMALRKAHHDKTKSAHGINVYTGKVEDMFRAHVVEPYRVGKQVLDSATEAAVMILRIDDVITAKRSEGGGGGAGGMPPGMGGGGMPGMMPGAGPF